MMSWDLAIDYNTGDLKIAPNNDFGVRTGREVVEQAIRARLRIHAGEWALDPTEGQLGSHMIDLMRAPIERALVDVPRVIREALAPMDTIDILDVTATLSDKDKRIINVDLRYAVSDAATSSLGDEQQLLTTVQIAG